MKYICCLGWLFIVVFSSSAQHGTIKGSVLLTGEKKASGALVYLLPGEINVHSNEEGKFVFRKIPFGEYTIKVEYVGAQRFQQVIRLYSSVLEVSIQLEEDTVSLDEVEIVGRKKNDFGVTNLKSVDGFGIYEGKKSEVVIMKEITANLSTNNARQAFSRITGLNIWESDGGGLQLGIGGRGLSPNRTANFNTRQNGYDISADALGYPESYYTPPLEAVKRIELVRGAASLQYGTQFGGMLNFDMNKGPKDKPLEVVSRQTIGSWNYRGSFNSIGGTVAKKKLNYYAFYQRKQGDGWRANTEYASNTAYVSLGYNVTPRFLINVDYTYMDYLAKQPGGLMDQQFLRNPEQSLRSRNFFKVGWNLMALTMDYHFTENTKLNVRNFGLVAFRSSLGYLGYVNTTDLGGPRNLIDGRFTNIGNETRLIHHYKIKKQEQTVLVGVRFYKGTTRNRQGYGADGSGPDFTKRYMGTGEGSDFSFPSWNAAVFAENIFNLSSRLSITPGVRYEYIKTISDGEYRNEVKDLAGNVVVVNQNFDRRERSRSLVLGGIGISYKMLNECEWYANFSQNYRAVNFSDIRVSNPNLVIDENIQDEKGYTADLGVRGNVMSFLRYEVTGFLVRYKGRIDNIERNVGPPTNREIRYRTNVGDARNTGVEAFAELDLWRLFNKNVKEKSVTIFGNFAYVNAFYLSGDKRIDGNEVALAPPLIFRAGLSFRYHGFRLAYQYSYTSRQFSDASNTPLGNGINGPIPEYEVMDITASYNWRILTLELSCNNMMDARYFTRRADAYPGPGILPSDARSYFMTLQIKM